METVQLYEQQIAPPQARFGEALDGLQTEVPEIAEDREAIERGGQALIEEMQIDEALFDDEPHTIVFTALAQRNAQLEATRDGMTDEEYGEEKDFILNATMLLALDKSGLYPAMKEQISTEEERDDAVLERVYDKFTNVQVTRDLQVAIDNGLLDDVKRRMQITDENEEPFVLRVLNIGGQDTLHGMLAPFTAFGDQEAWHEHSERWSAYEGYAAGLRANAREFQAATGLSSIPMAWNVTLDGRRQLNVALPTAEKILYPEVHADARAEDNAREQAILGHEYGHTQGSVNLNGKIFYGIGIEERRVESLSGNKQGYEDIKGFIDIDTMILSGVDVTKILTEAAKGGHAAEVYPQLANKFGLQGALELLLATPAHYISEDRPLQKAVNDHLGGINGIEKRLFERQSDESKERMNAIVDHWATQNVSNTAVDTWLHTRRSLFGLGFVTDKLDAALSEKRAAAAGLN